MEKAEGIVRYVMEGIFGRRGLRRASAELSYQEPLGGTPYCEDEPPAAGGGAYRRHPARAQEAWTPRAPEGKRQAEASGWTDWAEVVRAHKGGMASLR